MYTMSLSSWLYNYNIIVLQGNRATVTLAVRQLHDTYSMYTKSLSPWLYIYIIVLGMHLNVRNYLHCEITGGRLQPDTSCQYLTV